MEENRPIHPENVGYVAHPEDVYEPKYQIAIPNPSGSNMASARLGWQEICIHGPAISTKKSRRLRVQWTSDFLGIYKH
jgi:hypothetical protein